MSLLTRSSQSASTRTCILLCLYALVIIALPFARQLTAVQRLPIDSPAIAAWSELSNRTACPVKIPAALRIALDGRDGQWIDEVTRGLASYLDIASNGNGELSVSPASWCTNWHVTMSSTLSNSSQTAQPDFVYKVTNLATPTTAADRALRLPLDDLCHLTNYSPHSVALALARRIAIDLDLPYRKRILTPVSESPTKTDGEQDVETVPEAEAGPEVTLASQTNAPENTNISSPALPPLPDWEDDLETLAGLSGDALLPSTSIEALVDLPSHLWLQFHLLNEDLNLTSTTSLPLDLAFKTALEGQLHGLQEALSDITSLGYSSAWGIGKVARDVKWEAIPWTETRTWAEEVEVEEDEEIDCKADVDGDGSGEVGDDDSGSSESTEGGTSDRDSNKTCIVRHNTTRLISRSEAISRTSYYLSRDQLETFVDESGWALEDFASQGVTEEQFPYLFGFNSSRTSRNAATPMEIRTLHFVLYNPASHHRPLIYHDMGDVEDPSNPGPSLLTKTNEEEEESGVTALAEEAIKKQFLSRLASDQNGTESVWGWVVPSWGGVVMLPSVEEKRGEGVISLIERQLLDLLGAEDHPSRDDPQQPLSKERYFHLKRNTILQRVRDAITTLGSIQHSLDKLSNLEVGLSVQQSVSASLEALQLLLLLSTQNPSTTPLGEFAHLSLVAKLSAESAFQNPRMVGQLYFPAEHRYAVYTPLFGPLAVPLLLAGGKEVRKLLARRKKKKRKM